MSLIRLLYSGSIICTSSAFSVLSSSVKSFASNLPSTLISSLTTQEAYSILDLPVDCKSSDIINRRADTLISLNTPSNSFRGSPYIQKRVANARMFCLTNH
ncbi:hypothetical protein GEMRC1_007875 [Eukaryota sp. GEM-RC1]